MSASVSDKTFDVLISGASFAGLALARALSQALGDGARIAVVDRNAPTTNPQSDARAFALSAATKRMLTVLGIWDRLAPDAQEVSGIEITDSAWRPACARSCSNTTIMSRRASRRRSSCPPTRSPAR